MEKNQITIIINGIGFNCEVVARQTEEQYVASQMPLLFPKLRMQEREALIREVHKTCVQKFTSITGASLPVAESEQQEEPPLTEEPTTQTKKGRGKASPTNN